MIKNVPKDQSNSEALWNVS